MATVCFESKTGQGGNRAEAGDQITVSLEAPFTLVPLFNVGTITISARTTMRMEQPATNAGIASEPVCPQPASMRRRDMPNFVKRDERGQVVVFFALLIPVLLGLGGLAVGVGNWFVHGKHLQTKADAGAFAGGIEWEFPCGSQIDARIEAAARLYAGSNNPQVGGVPNDKRSHGAERERVVRRRLESFAAARGTRR